MATVFLATDTRCGRQVALKLVPTGIDREAREIVAAEQWGATLQERFCASSRYVPQVYEHGTAGGYFYIAMEYLEGQNLSDALARGPFPAPLAIDVAIQLCEFLEAAHGFETAVDGKPLRSLVHGDLKPRNIRVLDGDRIKVLDFGIAKALSLSRKVTRNDFGTFAYLSPEWFDSGGNIDSHVDLWAVGVLFYEMVTGAQPFAAPDTRRLEQRIRSRQPPAPIGRACPSGVQAVIAKLLAPSLADRYDSAAAIRQDLDRLKGGEPTVAEREGWPKPVVALDDEPPTRRTLRDAPLDEEATRRTVPPSPAAAPPAPVAAPSASPPVAARPPFRKRRRRWRLLRAALLVMAIFMAVNEYSVAMKATLVAREVPSRELDELADVWDQYDSLRARSSLHIGVLRLERALVRQSAALADRVIDNYRTPVPAVREMQWKMAREALARAADLAPDNARVRGSLRYCEGHLHRINGEARKARRRPADAQREFTDAVAAFREAAELRPNWPDPFLGLMRTFIYGLEDVDRAADALKQAERLGYVAGDRETVQLADGYRARGDLFAQTARSLAGMPQEQEYLTRAADAYRQAIDRYAKVIGFGDVPRSLRQSQRGLTQVEQRLSDLGLPRPSSSSPAATLRQAAPWL
jgi:serine/threonine protein kinase